MTQDLGHELDPVRYQELLEADAVARMVGAWVRRQILRRPGCLPAVEEALQGMQRSYEDRSAHDAAPAPADDAERPAADAASEPPADLALPPGLDYVSLPLWNQERLRGQERELLEQTLDVLRSPGLPGNWHDSLTRNIKSFRNGVAVEASRPRSPARGPRGSQKKATGGGQR